MKPNLNVSEAKLMNPVSSSETAVSFLPDVAPFRQGTATVIAQQFDQDVIADIGNAMTTFVESGQVWALIIGFVLGYMLRSVTTYK